jgi:hypothetical protein
MIQRLDLHRSENNQTNLKINELLFNMNDTLLENAFPIFTVQNEGSI